MTEDPRCTCYADHAWQGTVAIEQNVRIARDTFRLRFACPEIARRIVPGQFLMLRLAGTNDPLLGRPLALYDVICDSDGQPALLDVVYLVVGKMTRRLAALPPPTPLDVWGPLGNGFPPTETSHLVMVAGGIGQTPFLTLAQEYLGLKTFGDPPRRVPRAEAVTLCYGGRNRGYLAGVEDFRTCGVQVRLSTDDGSQGHHGLVTDLIGPVVEESPAACRIVCCGPEAMMETTAKIAHRLGLPCQVSLETPMACGIGICFSCVAKIRDASGQWDYRRTCVEGPVFAADDVEF
ncbi:MAG: dihydroorotate dehydrogenase electron transfer subunit [Pirellulales bacterium]|nr:dihydroorotate dehydrogenase electron transfer subunit [Pirellulales bacterium]